MFDNSYEAIRKWLAGPCRAIGVVHARTGRLNVLIDNAATIYGEAKPTTLSMTQ